MPRDPWPLCALLLLTGAAAACGLDLTVPGPPPPPQAPVEAGPPDARPPADAEVPDTSPPPDAAPPPCDEARAAPVTFAPAFAKARAYTFPLPAALAQFNRGACLVERDVLRVVRGVRSGATKVASYPIVRGACGRIDHLGPLESELDAPNGYGGLARAGAFLIVGTEGGFPPGAKAIAIAPGTPPRDVTGLETIVGQGGAFLVTARGDLATVRDLVFPSIYYRFKLASPPAVQGILAQNTTLLSRSFSGAVYADAPLTGFAGEGRPLLLSTHSNNPAEPSSIDVVRTNAAEDPAGSPEPFVTAAPNALGICFDAVGKAVISAGFEGQSGYLLEGF